METAQFSVLLQEAGVDLEWAAGRPQLFEQIAQSWRSTKACARTLDLISIGMVQGAPLSAKEGDSLRKVAALHAQYRESLRKLAPREVLRAIGEARAAELERDQMPVTASMAAILREAQAMIAADNLAVLTFLKSNAIDLNQKDRDGLTPCAVAAQHGADKCLFALCKNLGNPNISDSLGNAPTHWACAMGQPKALSVLLYHGVNPNAASQAGVTPLMLSLSKAHLDMAEKLLQYGADLGMADHRGNTALHRAVQSKSTSIVKFLLSAGAPIDVRNVEGLTPFGLAMRLPELAVMFNEERSRVEKPRDTQPRKVAR